MLIEIFRLSDSPTAKRGVMLLNGEPEFVTLELPWKGNQQNISCIPFGVYEIKHRASRKSVFGYTFEVMNVPNRSAILIHEGNTVDDIEGCILLGTKYGELHGKPAILESRAAMRRFLSRLTEDTYDLVLRDARA